LPEPEGEAVKVVNVDAWWDAEADAVAGPARNPEKVAAAAMATASKGLVVRKASLLLCRAGQHAGDECALRE
jgi:hypothetical protein